MLDSKSTFASLPGSSQKLCRSSKVGVCGTFGPKSICNITAIYNILLYKILLSLPSNCSINFVYRESPSQVTRGPQPILLPQLNPN